MNATTQVDETTQAPGPRLAVDVVALEDSPQCHEAVGVPCNVAVRLVHGAGLTANESWATTY